MKVDKTKWTTRCLGEVCTFSRGLTYPKSEETTEITDNVVLRSNNIDLSTHSLVLSDFKYLNSKYKVSSTKLVQRDSILMCMSNGSAAHIGKVAFIDKDYPYAFGGFMGLYKPINVFPKFLYYIFRSNTFKVALAKIGNGINITNLKFSSISPLLFNIPPLSEQRGIAAELDAIQAMIDGYQEQLADLDRLAQSIFLDTFGDPISNPKGWEKKKLKDLVTLINGRAYAQTELLAKGKYRVLRVGNLFSTKDFYYSDLELDEDKYISRGDLIYAWSCTFGAHIWNGEKVIYHYHIWKVKLLQNVNKHFMQYLLNMQTNYLMNQLHGVGMMHLTKSGMEKNMFIAPPLSLQQQFAEQVEAIERQKEAIRQQLADAETLMSERMQYYFS